MGKNLDDSLLSFCFLDIDNFYLLFSICWCRYNSGGSLILERVGLFIISLRILGIGVRRLL